MGVQTLRILPVMTAMPAVVTPSSVLRRKLSAERDDKIVYCTILHSLRPVDLLLATQNGSGRPRRTELAPQRPPDHATCLLGDSHR